jgi:CRISPR-associated protein Cas5d
LHDSYVRLKVSGPLACWTRPENKVERVSYECMTPSAARNILDAICWKPQMRWIVTRILVLSKSQFQSLRRNEVQSKIAPRTVSRWMAEPDAYQPQAAGAGSDDVTQRSTLALRNVSYIIEGYPHVFQPNGEDTPTKYMAMFNRRVEKGQCFSQPALGCREFTAEFGFPAPEDRPLSENVEIGRMLYDIVFRPEGNRAVFFEARLENGALDTRPESAIPDESLRQEVIQCSYKH